MRWWGTRWEPSTDEHIPLKPLCLAGGEIYLPGEPRGCIKEFPAKTVRSQSTPGEQVTLVLTPIKKTARVK